MKSDKAARISGYLARNSVRASLMAREKRKRTIEKQACFAMREVPEQQTRSSRGRGFRLFGANSKWSLVSFALIVIMLMIIMRMM